MPLYTAEPCDETDPAPGVRLLRVGVVLNRLSPDEALALAAELLVAAGGGLEFLSAADIAEHFGVNADTVQHWRDRYGPDRPPAELAKAPPCPEPDVALGAKRRLAGWRPDRLPEWDAWRASLPGRGAGGGRPPRQP